MSVGNLLTKLGLPIDDKDFALAESVANYGWAADHPWGVEAAQWVYGLKICGWLFGKFTLPPDVQLLIKILTVETQAAICQYVKDNPRKSQAELSAEVQRRLDVYAAQVDLIKRGVLVLHPGEETAAGSVPRVYPDGGGGARGGGYGPRVYPDGRGGGYAGKPAVASQPAVARPTSPVKTPDGRKPPGAKEPTSPPRTRSLLSFGSDSKSSDETKVFRKAEHPTGRKSDKVKQAKPAEKPATPTPTTAKPSPTPSQQSSKAPSQSSSSTSLSSLKQPESPEPVAVVEKSPVAAAAPQETVVRVPVETYQGTVVPADNFNPEEDAAALRKAMKGMGCDDKTVIAVLAFRSVAQRQEIAASFQGKFGKKLQSELDSELSGNTKSCVKGLMMEHDEYDAYLLYTAMKGLGTNESVLTEILASRPNSVLRRVRQRFANDYSKDLLQQIKSETSGDYRTFLLRLAEAEREESDTVDLGRARADAQALWDAGEGRHGTDEAVFIDILASRSHPQLRAMFDAYQEMFGREFLKVIESETSGDFRSALSAVVKCAVNTQSYFAEHLHKSMKGLGTNDDMLIRIIVTRCQIDTVQIKQRFQQLYGKSLKSFIEGDTSGNYKRLLLSLLDER